MKNFLTILLVLITTAAGARDFKVHGPQGGIAMDITLPKGFDPETGKCPMVILMHGIFSSGNIVPMPSLARELADALAMWEYAKSLPYVSGIALLGHSQGGVVASMTAGILESRGEKPAGLVLIAPGSVIQDACRNGRFFGAEFNPADPPEYVKCFGVMKLGREYILTTQELDIYGTAKAYTGPVRLIHGSKDNIVPMSCSEKFVETYGDRAELIVVDGENHMITRKRKKTVALSVEFFRELFSASH